ncbi:MAG: DUF3179 domain-containing protein [Wenzhouxiangellaceae bacterium]|nr:DUF3179 domain-containing protein [Wenzhouxiangellaceae bacterium]
MKALFATLLALLCLSDAVVGQEERPRNRFDHDILVETFGYNRDTPASVDFDHLYQGCPARDCIPAIDQPSYVDADAAAAFLSDDSLVMAIDHNGDKRAWPIYVLDFHEIVNDTIGGDPIAITWCPLCGSGLAFLRVVEGEVTEFGVSGVLHDSDLVMYDRKTDSLWQQITGEAIMGPALGQKLTEVPIAMTEWGRWREQHPDTRVLARDTGFDMPYSEQRRYGTYEESDRLMFPAANRDLSVHPKSVVHGFRIDGHALAVMDDSLNDGPIQTTLGARELTVRRNDDGHVTAIEANGTEHVGTRLFWFAWFNFNPDTQRL